MQQIVECVPNFSNGRDETVYNQIAEAIDSVPGVQVLDVSADPDHNRTVITFVGSPDSTEEAAFQGIATAAKLIDLDHHSGEHPRLGATDVCPFIPVRGVSMNDCAEIAQRLGQRVGDELDIAVYLYGAAATSPARRTVSAIRRGQYEAWKEEVGSNPERKPDYGPAEVRPWGATIIGARPFLIAYNLYLNSNRDDLAEKIARAVRFSNGGLRFVQAKGFLVDGRAQVSMNLTNFEKTPIFRVQEMVRREAAQFGLTITEAELVGLLPQQALIDSAKWYLQLDQMADDQILEYRLREEAPTDPDNGIPVPDDFVKAVADPSPTPGGGSVAALAGSLAAALAQMVAGLTVGRKNYAAVNSEAERLLVEATTLRQELLAAVSEDARAFKAVMEVYRDKSQDKNAKAVALEQATIYAGEVPLRVARLSRDAARVAAAIANIGNVNATTDAAAGAALARAAVQIAGLNVRINATGLQDQDLALSWKDELVDIEVEAVSLMEQALKTAAERGGF